VAGQLLRGCRGGDVSRKSSFAFAGQRDGVQCQKGKSLLNNGVSILMKYSAAMGFEAEWRTDTAGIAATPGWPGGAGKSDIGWVKAAVVVRGR
jgi:hypothetical protein